MPSNRDYFQGGRFFNSNFGPAVTLPKISDTWPKIVRPKRNVLSVEKATYIKDAQIKRKSNQSVLIVEDHTLLAIKRN